jgi:hypothetical protein
MNSGLGPAFIQCSRCGEVIDSDRSEWPDKTSIGKLRYIFVSIIYVIAGAFFGALCIRGAFHLWQNPGQEQMPPMGPGIAPGIIFGALLVLYVQITRISASIRRSKNQDTLPYRPPLLNLQIFIMPKVLGIMFCVPLLTWLIRIGLGRLGYIS